MSCSPDGAMSVPPAQQGITLAREAAYPFLEMLNDFSAGKARFGVATFPNHPSAGCGAQVVTPLTVVNDTTKTAKHFMQNQSRRTVLGDPTCRFRPRAHRRRARGTFRPHSRRTRR
jgi:hypothetical protein